MTILHSCCFWRSLRKGSYASGIFSVVWYTVNAIQTSIEFQEILAYYQSNFSVKPPSSLINHDTTSPTSIGYTIIILFLSSLGLCTCLLLFYGIYKDCRFYLIPWIANITAFICVDLSYVAYILYHHAIFNPPAGILVTMDLFINALYIYALLCVISQYQEYKAGRGRATDDMNNRIPNIQYSSQPTATSYLSTRKAITCQELKPTPTQSPSGTGPSLAIEEPSPVINHKGPRKSVKFPDHSGPAQNGSQLLDPWTLDVKSPMLLSKGADTAPLIETNSDQVVHTSV